MLLKIALFFVLVAISSGEDAKEKVKVTVFYESQCGDSIRFFKRQVKQAYDALNQHIDFEFVPYGKAVHEKLNDNFKFTCHHGSTECDYNKVQSCAIKYSPDQNTTVSFLSCVMGTYKQSSVLESCAKQSSLNLEKIKECASGSEGDELHAKHGDRTNSFRPSVSYVPTIVLNGVYNSATQYDAEYNLLATVCKKFKSKPDACTKS
ncbi:hypothetical protein LSTR_LSTR012695 [Laodelphax striatellus]|uniref:Uncharacterized protein n=1 Tax=Laodelphax striatellus TaxID=195883 RepID=A0A482XC64_LAOST|nr:hypothetical protein LSTR_LSTR012695 [Laodelphax striatellus]